MIYVLSITHISYKLNMYDIVYGYFSLCENFTSILNSQVVNENLTDIGCAVLSCSKDTRRPTLVCIYSNHPLSEDQTYNDNRTLKFPDFYISKFLDIFRTKKVKGKKKEKKKEKKLNKGKEKNKKDKSIYKDNKNKNGKSSEDNNSYELTSSENVYPTYYTNTDISGIYPRKNDNRFYHIT